MRCLECGYLNESNVSDCIKCGTLLVPSSKIKASETKAPEPKMPESKPTEIIRDEVKPSGNPTIRGDASNMPSWDAPAVTPETEKKHTYFTCASCQYYPLAEAPSAEHPCPNCGHGSEAKKASGTMKLGDIRLGETEYEVLVKEEGSDKEFRMEGSELNLNRELLDENNKTISAGNHARISSENGAFFLEDSSSNAATFVQVKGKVKLEDGQRIILGNKIYQLSIREK